MSGPPRRSAGWAMLVLALSALLGAGRATAQDGSDVPPPARFLTDENGIDVARGEHLINVTDISIGTIGQGGLAYTRQLRRTGGGNPYDLALFQAGLYWTASVGLRSYAFVQSGSTYTSTDGSGAILVQGANGWTLTLPDGTVILYDYNIIETSTPWRKSRASHIDYPNGDEVDLHWHSVQYCVGGDPDTCFGGTWNVAVRLQAVSSPLGYQLYFNYAGNVLLFPSQVAAWRRLNEIIALNTTVESCDPETPPCSPAGTWPTVTYSISGVTDPAGRTSVYTTTGTTFAIRRPGSASDDIVYTYGADGKIDSVVRDGATWTYDYSVAGTTATMTVTDPSGDDRVIVSDLNVGLPTSITNELDQTISYTYDSAGRLRRATAPEQNYVEYTYDSRGNTTQTQFVPKPGVGGPTLTTSAVFPATCPNPSTCNQPTSTTDARGNTTDYTYDPTHGGLLTSTRPAQLNGVRPQIRFTYSSFSTPGGTTVHRPTNISECQALSSCNGQADETELVIAYAHPNLMVSSATRRNGTATLSATVTYGYDNAGNPITIDGPLAGTADTVRTRYNLDREVTGIISADPDGAGSLEPRALRITRSATTGLVTRSETGTVDSQSEADWSTFAMIERIDMVYDGAERPTRRTLMGTDLVARAQIQISYDSEGRLQCMAVRMNPAEYATPPASACTLDTAHATYGQDRISRTSYDAANRVTLLQTGYGVTGVQASDVAIAYTTNGRILHRTDANGNRTTYEYDGHDRLVKTRFPNPPLGAGTSSTIDYEQRTLDANGNVVTLRLRDGQTIGFTYDALNRTTAKNLPGTEPDVSYGLDNLGRLTSAALAGGQTLSFTYDALGRNLTQVGPLGTVSYQYDLAGRRTRLTYPGTGLYVQYDYLVTDEVTKIRENGATSGVGVLATYGYDQLGRRTSLTRGNGSAATYDYDPISRLEELVENLPGTTHDLTLGFSYNPAGQIVSNTRSNDLFSYADHVNVSRTDEIDGLNRVTDTGGTSVEYDDDRGNITQIGAAAFAYNSDNMLISGGGLTLSYDPLRRLYQAGSTRWLYDGATMIAEYSSSSALQRRFVHGPSSSEPLVWYEGTGTSDRRFLHADERGSIIAISNSSGTVTDINRYDEYGVPQAGNAGRFQYAGQAWFGAFGLYYLRARMYNPTLGRFMQTDPVRYAAGMNLYAYVFNDPMNLTDPSGLYPPESDSESFEVFCSGNACGNPGVTVIGKRPPRPRPVIVAMPNPGGGGGAGESGGVGGPEEPAADDEEQQPDCLDQPGEEEYDTAEEAGAAGARLAEWHRRNNDHKREWGGRIRPSPNNYQFLAPIEGPRPSGNNPAGFEYIGLLSDAGWYHVHTPGGDESLSGKDINTVGRFVDRGNTSFVTVLGADLGNNRRIYAWRGGTNIEGAPDQDLGPLQCE